MNKKGFTLIEILVVIVLIGMLSAITITSIQNTKNNALDALTAEEEKVIKEALRMVAVDLDDESSEIFNCKRWPHYCVYDENEHWSYVKAEVYELIEKGYLVDNYGHCSGNSFITRNNGNYIIEFEDVICN